MPSVEENVLSLDKSLVDHRSYRFIQLENGLRAIVISNLKPGESIPEDSSSEEDDDEEDAPDDGMIDNEAETEVADVNPGPDEHSENQSAAALCIQVGSFSDPLDAQGLSHFLEHMVFMGSKKYPTENDFDAYLSRRGGQSNAWTGNEHTLFHFDVKRKHFASCLDRFAQFFISPLLQQDSMDRELAAVHSEFELSNARDSSRVQFFISSLAKKESPYRIFSYGNMKSLREIPEENGTDIYSLLQKHRLTMYSSHRMTLALHSKDSLDNLEAMVRRMFSSVPNSGKPPADLSKFTDSFNNPSFNKFYRVCPIGDREKLRVVWALPPLRNAYESIPMQVISSLVGHECNGSVLALLKAKNLAVSLVCGVCPTSDFEQSSICTLFIVYITLTDDGRDNVNEVCRILFDYFKVLRNSALVCDVSSDGSSNGHLNSPNNRRIHTLHSYLLEYQSTHEAAFLYSEPEEPEDTVVHVANMMQLVPPERVFSAYHLLRKIDTQLLTDILQHFIPERAAIILLSGKFASSITPNTTLQIEPWFNIRYTAEDISPEVLQDWQQSVPDTALHLPYTNAFLTSNFDLLPMKEDMKFPIDLNASADGIYRRRYGQLCLLRCPPLVAAGAKIERKVSMNLFYYASYTMALHMILTYSLNQTLSTIAYEGGEANLSYNLEYTESGLKICLNGFNEKLFFFYKTILDHIMSGASETSVSHFESYRESIRQLCFNESLKPKILNTHLQFYLLRKDTFLFDNLLSAIQNLSVADLLAYKQRFFSQLRITAYVHGNLTAESAIEFFDYTTRRTACTPLPKRKFTDTTNLSPGTYQLRVMNCNPSDVNMCIARVHLLGKTDLKRDTYNQLLASILSEPAFDFLRTKETLGYHVYLRCWRSSPGGNLHSGISLVACSQANRFSASYVTGRLTTFWYRIAPRILAAMSPDAFQTAVESLITMKQLEDPNMLTEVDRNWEEILVGEAMFNRRDACVKILKTIKKEDLFEFFLKEYLEPGNQRSLLIQVDAPPQGDPNFVIPQKSYSLDIRHVPINDQFLSEEQRSSNEVNVDAAVTACGYSCSKAAEFLNKWDPKLSHVDFSPDAHDSICINNVRSFRSGLSYENGRVV
ncbi:Nardilysin [Paragonimus heterotremus]|uniref:Nardilysin n=1 Tax=Paragonimus heterotremus TaxID=100268 RepID=A0A8J4SQN9_9TREM|nr:Nardilysin [Paragonimus heterotremus]